MLGHLALLDAAQGRERDCKAHADEAVAMVEGTERKRQPEIAEALALLALGMGRPVDTLEHLETAFATGVNGTARWLPRASLGDLVEAYVRLGRRPPRQVLAAVRRAAEGDFDGSAAVAERCRALLAPDETFDAHFGRALQLHGAVWPFARARTELCYGERLRRAGRRVDARKQLRAARETFERLGAHPWAERAEAELRATGERIRRRDPTAAEQLTP